MVLTKEVDLPDFSTLTVPEVNVSTATLISASPYIGKYCEAVNNEFMLCRLESNDPRPCLDLGKQVTHCTLELFKCIKKSCLVEFNQYANCIDKSSGNFCLTKCRKTQAVFDDCMKDKLDLNRPDFGYFCRTKIHNSPSAPRVEECPCQPRYPDATASLPNCKPRTPARYGGRAYWFME